MRSIYFPNLNGLRFFAALSVMIYHFFGIDVINGHFGVVLFFVLSGFLITYLLLEEKSQTNNIAIRKFYIRRILRIWPLYFFILFLASLSYFFIGPQNGNYQDALPYYLFFAPNIAFSLDLTIRYVQILWSVGSEEQFYLVWPWFIAKFQKQQFLIFLILIITTWVLLPQTIDYINFHFLGESSSIKVISKVIGRMGFGSMATGAFLAYFAKFKPEKLLFIFSMQAQIGTLLVVISIWFLNPLPHTALSDQIFATLFAVLIANFALNPKVLISLENKILNYLGKISFGLYVYHLMAFSLVRYMKVQLDISIPYVLLFFLGLILTIIMASASYQFLEKPFLKIKSKKYTTVKSSNDPGNI
ncbi:MAG: acyltransferase [Crocinitomicaceae bacterium]|nr:acyltransferase [Crocinitomicaceae bacterium]